ncbi:unnamed protein product [Acanthosepion pharaonis]|uniref:Uncharacterized protein n=1 Tax=Acanthosepion pharaonis TaxID=158019 RepID=A0A812DN82_ACAPH|nr:unnamed protein product [Sepia pharaonis]
MASPGLQRVRSKMLAPRRTVPASSNASGAPLVVQRTPAMTKVRRSPAPPQLSVEVLIPIIGIEQPCGDAARRSSLLLKRKTVFQPLGDGQTCRRRREPDKLPPLTPPRTVSPSTRALPLPRPLPDKSVECRLPCSIWNRRRQQGRILHPFRPYPQPGEPEAGRSGRVIILRSGSGNRIDGGQNCCCRPVFQPPAQIDVIGHANEVEDVTGRPTAEAGNLRPPEYGETKASAIRVKRAAALPLFACLRQLDRVLRDLRDRVAVAEPVSREDGRGNCAGGSVLRSPLFRQDDMRRSQPWAGGVLLMGALSMPPPASGAKRGCGNKHPPPDANPRQSAIVNPIVDRTPA